MYISRTSHGLTTTVEVRPLPNFIGCCLIIGGGCLLLRLFAALPNHPVGLIVVGPVAILLGVAGIQRTFRLMAEAGRTYRGQPVQDDGGETIQRFPNLAGIAITLFLIGISPLALAEISIHRSWVDNIESAAFAVPGALTLIYWARRWGLFHLIARLAQSRQPPAAPEVLSNVVVPFRKKGQ
jgi:hypothetical protein